MDKIPMITSILIVLVIAIISSLFALDVISLNEGVETTTRVVSVLVILGLASIVIIFITRKRK
jgi:hypothetical protein